MEDRLILEMFHCDGVIQTAVKSQKCNRICLSIKEKNFSGNPDKMKISKLKLKEIHFIIKLHVSKYA